MNSESPGSPSRHADDKPSATEPDQTSDAEDDKVAPCPPAEEAEVESEDTSTADAVQECLDADLQHRLWLKAVVPLLQLRTQETDTGIVPGVCSGRVQFAFDRMYVAACERIARILRSDLGSDQD
jgi:hypothetical protein